MSGLPTALVTIDVSAAALLVMLFTPLVMPPTSSSCEFTPLRVICAPARREQCPRGSGGSSRLPRQGVPELEQRDGQEEDEQYESHRPR